MDEGERRVALLSTKTACPPLSAVGLDDENGYTLNGARGGSTKEGLKVQLVYRCGEWDRSAFGGEGRGAWSPDGLISLGGIRQMLRERWIA